MDSYAHASSDLGQLIRERGIRSEVGAPVVVEGQLWGGVIAGTDRAEPMPTRSEHRIARFADLIATAVANAVTRSELVASGARIVAAGDEARRRVERDFHDGTQQRLVTVHYIRPDGTPFPAADCPLLRPRMTGDTVHVDEDWFVRQDGTLTRVTYSSAPIALPDGRGAVVLFRESTS